jgi:hypothetical protein
LVTYTSGFPWVGQVLEMMQQSFRGDFIHPSHYQL